MSLFKFQGLYFAGLFLFHSGRHDKAREYVDRMLKQAPTAKEVGIFLEFLLSVGSIGKKSDSSEFVFTILGISH